MYKTSYHETWQEPWMATTSFNYFTTQLDAEELKCFTAQEIARIHNQFPGKNFDSLWVEFVPENPDFNDPERFECTSCEFPVSIEKTGDLLRATPTGAVAPFVFSWNPQLPEIPAPGSHSNPNFTSDTLFVSSPGTYTILVTDANGCTGTKSITVQ